MQKDGKEEYEQQGVRAVHLRGSGHAEPCAAAYCQQSRAAEQHKGYVVGQQRLLHADGMAQGHYADDA